MLISRASKGLHLELLHQKSRESFLEKFNNPLLSINHVMLLFLLHIQQIGLAKNTHFNDKGA
jgi:hypothetical protein